MIDIDANCYLENNGFRRMKSVCMRLKGMIFQL